MKSRTQSGVALVITLLMLSVITFLTVAFLAISRRDRASVGMSLTQREARNMADAAAQRAQADIVSRMFSTRNIAGMPEFLNYDLMVSRNYISANGFDPALNPVNRSNVENVSYEYRTGGLVTNADDLALLAGNLFYDPRPPVFVKTNSDSTKPLDFRFWVDVNRNGRFETNGRTLEQAVGGSTSNINYVAEPEWIGMLRNPEFVHSATNPFIGRYAYLVAPIGKTLDWNYIHNFAKSSRLGIDDFQRNQGVGSWEINLAGLLASANTNVWKYRYPTNDVRQTTTAFEDAASILRYRYNGDKAKLANARTTLGPIDNIFANDMVDSVGDGPLQMTTAPLKTDADKAAGFNPWSGSDNPAAYYDPQEMFDSAKTSGGDTLRTFGFTNRLYAAGTNWDSYNRYTMARLLGSIGTGSEPELQVDIFAGRNSVFRTNTWDRRTKVNLNYANTNEIAKGLNTSQTNYQDWTPIAFFTNAADLILRSQFQDDTNYTITNLWIYTSNTNRPDIRYSAKIHRCLQLAANLYDATTGTNENLPSVFRPIFRQNDKTGTTNVYIVGFEEVTNNAQQVIKYGFRDLGRPLPNHNNYNLWGIPWVIGAKKGLPNFNEVTSSNSVSFERKLEFWKGTDLKAPPTSTNQMYILAFTNYTGLEIWNSYRTNWNRDVWVMITNEVRIGFTNELGPVDLKYSGTSTGYTNSLYRRLSANTMKGFTDPSSAKNSLWVPFTTNSMTMEYARFDESGTNRLLKTSQDSVESKTPRVVRYHTFGVTITNRFFYAMIDDKTKRLIDFVNIGEFRKGADLSAVASNKVAGLNVPNPWARGLQGVSNQIALALSPELATDDRIWNSTYNRSGVEPDSSFRNWWNNTTGDQIPDYMACPFQPLTVQDLTSSFEANDPLVHYTQEDLTNPERNMYSIGEINPRASTWSGTFGGRGTGAKFNKTILTDPQINCSDDWDFPTNKYPNVGWIGRVHRGTPWQTIFLKADSGNETNLWPLWVKQGKSSNNNLDTYPTTDWVLPDLFTVAPNDNAARGTLSVNQTNLAAWSAIFSGVIALKDANTPVVIDPVDVPRLVGGLNAARAKMPGKVFHKTGELFAAPELTIQSPFIAELSNTNVTDAVVERIPQQTLSLLKVGQPRFVIWAYGQSLKPQSVYMGAKYQKLFGIPTNYQITGESLTRTVCRLEYGNATNIVPRIVVESFNVVPGDQ